MDELAGVAHAEGGWGYEPGQPSQPEPTCLALLALSLQRERFAGAIDGGLRFLESRRAADDSYRASRVEAVWPTAQVVFTLSTLGLSPEQVLPGASRLLAFKGETVKDPDVGACQDIDVKLVGWPWGEGNFSWVEPTAWAILALRRAGFGHNERVGEGTKLLLDRAFDEGGINYGNRVIFGKTTEPVPTPTALMLLALQVPGIDHPRIAAALGYLEQTAAVTDDLEHLCWAKLALEVHGREVSGIAEKIHAARETRLASRWLRLSVMRDALTCLALTANANHPFNLRTLGPASEGSGQAATPVKLGRPIGERVKGAFQGFAVKALAQLRQPPLQSTVHIAPVADYNADLADTLARQYESFRERVPLKGKRVVLKPNLVEYHRDKVINTHPNVIAAVIELCKREGAGEIIVAEGPGHWRNVEYLVSASGLGDVLRHYSVRFVDLNHDEPVRQVNLGRATGLQHLYMTRTVVSAEVLISLPKLKTHHWAGATLSLKNLFGTMPGTCYGWPKNELHWRGIDNSIIDIALTRTPDLAIVDGIVGMEGDGPLNGVARPLGVLIMGNDCLAVDATCCRLMQLDPEQVPYMQLGQFKKLGRLREAEISQLGEVIAARAQPFETLPEFRKWYRGRTA
ncbi:MAG: DUF362 domain-containing protein [Gemmataceae bacterium]|nr:DUF362 domain-containing protein [Gemmataceae bacterium]